MQVKIYFWTHTLHLILADAEISYHLISQKLWEPLLDTFLSVFIYGYTKLLFALLSSCDLFFQIILMVGQVSWK